MSKNYSNGFETSVKSPFSTSTEDRTYYPPCVTACPAHINVQGYVSLISQGRFKESIDLIRKTIPFPAVCGRVCFSPCEENCHRGLRDEPVSTRLLKRLVSDTEYYEKFLNTAEPTPKTHKESVAIIGSGPAGMTAAYNLVKMGYPVTVYEKENKVGGMLRTHIPRYRLPESTLDAELNYIHDLGVELKTGTEITVDDWERLRTEHEAVFVSVGAQVSNTMKIPGEDLDGAYARVRVSTPSVDLGNAVTVAGSLGSYVQSVDIQVTFTQPDGTDVIFDVTTDGGNYALDFQPDQLGEWEVQSSWIGDSGHGESSSEVKTITVLEETEPENSGIPGFYIEAILVGLLVYYLKKAGS